MKKMINRLRNIYKDIPLVNVLYKPMHYLLIKIDKLKKPRQFYMILDFNDLMKKYNLKIKGILQIGAHWGNEYEIYHKHKISNLIFFEPLPRIFKVLEKNLKDKAILVNLALGNKNHKIKMYVTHGNDGQPSSILKPKLHLNQYPQIKFNKIIEVKMVKLDDFSKSNHNLKIGENYNFISIDVQGYELEVFKGGKEVLSNIDYIITEVNRAELYEGCVMVEELDEFLSDFGFIRVETLWVGETWGDAFYIKK